MEGSAAAAAGGGAAPVAAPASGWTRALLLYAQRQSLIVPTRTLGVRGRVLEVRERDVVLALTAGRPGLTEHVYGKGYVSFDALGDAPQQHASGARVRTPFGRGIVLAARATEERLDYAVKLLDCRLANATFATGYFAPTVVQARSRTDLSFPELLEDANAQRGAGNEAFKARDWAQAIVHYQESQETLSFVQNLGRQLDEEERKLLITAFIRALANAAQCFLSMGGEDNLRACVRACDQALGLDSQNVAGTLDKVLMRRGSALAGLKQWDEALDTFSHPLIARSPDMKAKAAEVREARKAEKDAEKKLWAAAFAKNATTPEPAEDGKGAAASPAAGPSVRFAPTPSKGDAEEGADGAAGSPLGRARAHKGTPHPKAKGAGRRIAGDEEDDEKEEAGAGAGKAGASVEAQAEAAASGEEGSSWLPWALGGVAVAGAAALGFYLLRNRR